MHREKPNPAKVPHPHTPLGAESGRRCCPSIQKTTNTKETTVHDMSTDVIERLMPTVARYVAEADWLPASLLESPGLITFTCWMNTDRSHGVNVTALLDTGPSMIMVLDPARFGLCLIGDELVTLEDPGEAFAPG